MSFFKRKLLLLLLVITTFGTFSFSKENEYNIYILTSRPTSDLESGFMNFIKEKDIKVKFTILNTLGDSKLLPKFVKQIKEAKPDLIFSVATPQTLSLVGTYDNFDKEKYITDIPVIFSYVAFPVESKIVPSLESSNRNVTGTIHIPPIDLQLDTILKYKNVKTIGTVYSNFEINSKINVQLMEEECKKRDIKFVSYPVDIDNDGKPISYSIIKYVYKMYKDDDIEFLYLSPDTYVSLYIKDIIKIVFEYNIPTFTVNEPLVRNEQVLLGLVPKAYSLGQLTAYKAIPILLGQKKPQDEKIERIKKFQVVINQATALKLNMPSPLELVDIADIVF